MTEVGVLITIIYTMVGICIASFLDKDSSGDFEIFVIIFWPLWLLFYAIIMVIIGTVLFILELIEKERQE